jgi:predicted anti-sigma-YlaC factor YlaD
MTHDRTRISALVDGECSVDERDAVLAHVIGCDDCRAFYQQERAAKAALAAGSPSGPTASTSLMSSLLALAATSPASSAPDRRAPERPAPRRVPVTGPARPVELPGQRRRRVRRAAKGIGFSLLGASLLVAAAFVIGGDAGARIAAPAIAAFGDDHQQAVASAQATGTALTNASATAPGGLAAGADLVLTTSLAPATLAGFALVSTSAAERGSTRSTYRAGGKSISVFRQDGRLDAASLDGFRTHKVDGAKMKRKTGEPGYLVWSCDDVTYTVVGTGNGDLDRVAAALPHGCADKGGWSRVGRGMHRAAGWLNPLS